MSLPLAACLAILTAVVTGLGSRFLLPAIPEPTEPGDKPPYATLADAPMIISTSVVAGLTMAYCCLALPWQLLPSWSIFASLGLILVAIDARTTWLPLWLTRPLWFAAALATALTGILAGWPKALIMVLTATAVLIFFAAFWRLSGGQLAFGDVRFAPVLGAVTGSVSVGTTIWALLLGSTIGVMWGLASWLSGKRGGFAYAPALWLGAVLALPVTAPLPWT